MYLPQLVGVLMACICATHCNPIQNKKVSSEYQDHDIFDVATVYFVRQPSVKHRVKRNTAKLLHIQSELNTSHTMDLRLKYNNKLQIEATYWRGESPFLLNSDCKFYTGKISGDPSTVASLVACGNSVSGVIINDKQPIFIRPLLTDVLGVQHVLYFENNTNSDVLNDMSTYLQHIKSTSRTKRLAYLSNVTRVSSLDDLRKVVVTSTDENESEQETVTSSSLLDDTGYTLDKLWDLQLTAEARRKPSKSHRRIRWLKLALTVDHSVIEFHGREQVQLYVLSLMNIVSAVYADPSLDSNLRISIVKMAFLEDEDEGKVVEGNSKASLENVNRWNQEETEEVYHDAAVWLTKLDLGGPSGYAPVSGVCDPARSCTLNRDEGLSSAFIIAHELGHVLGLSHDGDLAMGNNCTSEAQRGSVMAAMVSATFHRFHWSRCSYREFHSKANKWACLNKRARTKDTTMLTSLINASFSMDEQCRMEFGEGFGLCRSFELPAPCAHLWCSHDEKPLVCRTKKGPPLEGTECGFNQWCIGGRCKDINPRYLLWSPVIHNARDGGWGGWSAWNPCSRTCGFGISFRTRTCNAPIPQFGGANCKGKSEEFHVCNRDVCPLPLRDFRAQQCSTKANKNGSYELLPVEFDETEFKCQLICVIGKTGKILRTSENLVDGTTCSYDQHSSDICIQGVCQAMGCDGQFNSKKKVDLCGVCGGNNEACHNITTLSSKVARKPLTKLVVIPTNTRNLLIHISSPSSSSIRYLHGRMMLRTRRKRTYRLSSRIASIVEGARFHMTSTSASLMISARGPLLSELTLAVTTMPKERFPGLHLLIETLYVLHRDDVMPGQYRWEMGGWGPCSASCGAQGKRQRTLACRNVATGKLVPRKNCPLLTKPNNMPFEVCKTPECMHRWISNAWEDCSVTCGSRGTKSRQVFCVTSHPPARIVHPSLCADIPQPDIKQTCNNHACPVQWLVGEWSQCSVSCGAGISRRILRCPAPRGEPLFSCGPPPNETRVCAGKSCESKKICNNNVSELCGLPLLQKYCTLPPFKKLCCKICSMFF